MSANDVKQLLKALKPFARVGKLLLPSDPNTENIFGISCAEGSASVKNGHFKRAAKVYERVKR